MNIQAFRFVPVVALLAVLGEAGTFPSEVVTTDISASSDNDTKHGTVYQTWYHPYGTVSGVPAPVHEYCNACGNAQAGYKMRIYSKQDPTKEKFDKPVFITQGFDPDQGSTGQFTFDNFRDMLSYTYKESYPYSLTPDQNLLKELYEDNYDVVLVMFYNSNIDIPTQAMNLEQAYLWLKSVSSTDNLTEPAIIGPSMGGLVTRYMLGEAGKKTNSGGVNSRLFIAWDSPNVGAEIPMSLQAAVKYLSGYDADAETLDRNLGSEAAAQMLFTQRHGRVDESESDYVTDYDLLGNADYGVAHGNFDLKLNDWREWQGVYNVKSNDGFTKIRTVAISNGSRQGAAGQRGIPPSFEYWNWSGDIAKLSLKTSASNVNTEVFYGNSPDQWQWHYHFSEPAFLENMPGGVRTSYNQFRNIISGAFSKLIGFDITFSLDSRLVAGHCFVPTVSALGYGAFNTHDQAYFLSTSGYTDFNETYAPLENQDHVRITEENKKWILDALKAYGPRPNSVVSVVRPMLF